VCNFDCAYCEVSRALPVQAGADAWPTPRAVAEALAIALRRCGRLDSITISGHGEPTLHPRFAAVVQCILEEALRHRPRVPVRILTNGSGAVRPEVRRALDRLDERIATIDAGAEKLDRPCPHAPLGSIVHGLTMLRDVTAQSCFVEGVVSNVGDDTVADWAELVAEIQPRRVQIYTVNRIPAACGVWPASPARLQEIASVLRARTGISADVFS
jgi:wyosine [tRNA(Phe)-imidazoG37] synthetase (radical SAM superfamily)